MQNLRLLFGFLKKVAVSSEYFHEGTPCWIWQASIKTKTGYGSFGWGRRSYSIPAHRACFLLFVGSIPEGLELDHLCRRRACVNPDHLEPVTTKVNNNRGIGPECARQRQLAKTHCPKGHEYTEANTYRFGKNYRACRQCRRDLEKAQCKGRSTKTHCVNGHPYTTESTYTDKNGWRSCLICRRGGKPLRT
jgi:hypothetical protein